MSKSARADILARIVAVRYVEQDGRCYYCERTCWVRRLFSDCRFPVRIKLAQLRDLMATAEHLKRRVDGGTDAPENIVMACYRCNTDRGERSVLDHVKFSRQRFQRWNQAAEVSA